METMRTNDLDYHNNDLFASGMEIDAYEDVDNVIILEDWIDRFLECLIFIVNFIV